MKDECSDLGTDGRATCDEGFYCEKHFKEAEAEFSYLKGLPRHAVCNDAEAKEELEQELRDAGHGHLFAEDAHSWQEELEEQTYQMTHSFNEPR